MRISWFLLVLIVLGCRDNQRHVFQAPRPPAPSGCASASVAAAPDVPIGSAGPEARITAVADAATGAPVTLSAIPATFQVLSIVARGKYDFPPNAVVYVDIAIRGRMDTTMAVHFGSPAPSIMAHAFEVPVARAGQPGLVPGSYSAQVRLMVNERPLVSSAPIYFTVN
ncbi:MAG: hypothetical protein JWM95_816 [Gemmatimonadetes bacterium]|nr:hypothetical protein [Gemmatimonadota bacterium]